MLRHCSPSNPHGVLGWKGGAGACFLYGMCVPPPPFSRSLAPAGGTCRGRSSLARHRGTCAGTAGGNRARGTAGSRGGGTGPTLPPSLAAGCISPSLSLAPPTRLLLLIFNFISQTPCLIKRRHLSLRADVGYLLLQTSVGRMLPRRNTPPTGYFTGIKRGADTPTPPPSPPQGALRGKDAVFLHHRAFSFPSSFNNNALKMFDICNKQLASCYGRMSFYFRAG